MINQQWASQRERADGRKIEKFESEASVQLSRRDATSSFHNVASDLPKLKLFSNLISPAAAPATNTQIISFFPWQEPGDQQCSVFLYPSFSLCALLLFCSSVLMCQRQLSVNPRTDPSNGNTSPQSTPERTHIYTHTHTHIYIQTHRGRIFTVQLL